MVKPKVRVDFEVRKDCWVSFDARYVQEEDLLVLDVPEVFQDFFDKLKKNPNKSIGYAHSVSFAS